MSDEQGTDLLDVGTLEEQPAEEADNQPTVVSEEPGETSVEEDDSEDRPGWMDQLAGDLKENKALYKFKSASDAVKSLVELEGKLGKSVTLSDDPTDEELSRVRTLLGVPDSPDGYDFSKVELPKGYKGLTEAAMKEYAKHAHENGLTQGQAAAELQRTAQREFEAIRQVRQVIKEGREKSEARLRTELGADYDKHLKAANTVLQAYGDQELASALKDSGFLNSPALTRFLGKVGLAVSEGEAPDGVTPPKAPPKNAAFPFAAKVQAERSSYYDD